MKISDAIGMCLRNLFRRKFRTFLTVMGVVIGTCAVVVMISLGLGISISQEAWLNSIGDLTVIEVYGRSYDDDTALDDEAVAAMQQLPGVEIATPLMSLDFDQGYSRVFAGKKERYGNWGSVIGIYPEALESLGFTLAEGEMLKPGARNPQLVFCSYAVYEFYNTRNYDSIWYWPGSGEEPPEPFFDPMDTPVVFRTYYWGGTTEKTTKYECEVTGILAPNSNDYYSIYMHLDDMKRIKAEYEKENGIKRDRTKKESYNNVKVKVGAVKDVAEVQTAIDTMGFQTYSMEEIRQSMQESAQQTLMILGILGAVSLFVSAISIANTMIMSVYERTREIGVMKVLGCRVGDIRLMFLTEAGLIGFLGGCVGIGLSYLFSYLINTYGAVLGNFLGNYPVLEDASLSMIPPWLVVLGIAFATLIGLVSGILPALRAVKISALEAIKTE